MIHSWGAKELRSADFKSQADEKTIIFNGTKPSGNFDTVMFQNKKKSIVDRPPPNCGTDQPPTSLKIF